MMSLYSFGDNNPNRKRSVAIGTNPRRVYVPASLRNAPSLAPSGFGGSPWQDFIDSLPDWLFPSMHSTGTIPLNRTTPNIGPLTPFQRQAQINEQKSKQQSLYEQSSFLDDFLQSTQLNWKQNLKDAAKVAGETVGTGVGAGVEALGAGIGSGASSASQFDWSKIIIWGSVAIGAVILFKYVTKPRYAPGY